MGIIYSRSSITSDGSNIDPTIYTVLRKHKTNPLVEAMIKRASVKEQMIRSAIQQTNSNNIPTNANFIERGTSGRASVKLENAKQPGTRQQYIIAFPTPKKEARNNSVRGVNGSGYSGGTKINCSLESYLFEKLPSNVLGIIFTCLMSDYHSLILVSPRWYTRFHECIETDLLRIDQQFTKTYAGQLLLLQAELLVTPIQVNGVKGIRMDRCIAAQVLPSVAGKAMALKCTYRSYRRSHDRQGSGNKLKKYACEYRIDALSKNANRTIWAYKEDCKHNYDKQKEAFVQPICPVRVGDYVRIPVNFFSMNGLTKISTVEWKPVVFSDIPRIPIQLSPRKIASYDKERICEIEDIYTDWVLFEYFLNINKKKIDIFEPYLTLKEVHCAGVDIITSKHIFIAKQPTPGILLRSEEKLGLQLKIVSDEEPQVCEVKRQGLFQDVQGTLTLRIGDTFIFYLSAGD